MLLRNNIVIPAGFLISRAAISAKTGRTLARLPIIAAMTDADELARRYFALWAEYLTALVADPQAAAMLQRWIDLTGQFVKVAEPTGERAGNPFPAWPPAPAGVGPRTAAATAARASGERSGALDELARRVGELERKLAALEQQPATRRPRRRNRASGK
jgi:hypothetical protein